MKKIFLLLSFFISFNSFSEEITILRMAKAGGGLSNWTNAIIETLENNKYKTKLIGFSNCVEASNYIKNNPKKPIMFVTFSDWVIQDMVDSTAKGACSIEIKRNELVGIQGKYWNFICGKKDINDSIEMLANGNNWKIATSNLPISNIVSREYFKKISPNSDLIRIYSGKDMLQSFISGDVDYVVINSENMISSIKTASCFLTTANVEMRDLYMPNRISFEELNDVPFIGFGLWHLLIAKNIDIKEMRNVFENNSGTMLEKLKTSFVQVNTSAEEQYDELLNIAKEIKPLLN